MEAASNTTDSYVPKLTQHTFSTEGLVQPQLNIEEDEAFTGRWVGYIKVETDLVNPTLELSGDDHASVTLAAFTGGDDCTVELAEVEGSVYGGGAYRTESIILNGTVKAGYYLVTINYSNVEINPDWSNVAQLDVKLNGTQIELGALTATNLITQTKATSLMDAYAQYSYTEKSTKEVWAAIGGWLNEKHLEAYDSEGVPDTSHDYYNSCALRLSIALNNAGYDLSKAAGANNILTGNSDVLNGNKHVIISASQMLIYLQGIFSDTHYTTTDYDAETLLEGMLESKKGDCFIFAASGHVGIATYDDRSMGNHSTEPLWLIKRTTWGNPEADE